MQAYPNREMMQMYLDEEISPEPYTARRAVNSLKKRLFDLVFACLVTLLILSWLIPIVSLLIWWTSRGPVMFIQLRTGRDGKHFWCLKFRTMTYVPNAAFIQAKINDKRVTPIGRFLRRTNLDEMPQFLNVLMGDMSVVGPRPHPLPLDAKYWDSMSGYQERYIVKPGITGLAQAKGARGETETETETDYKMKHRLRYDLLYIRRQSIRLDIKICFMTVKAAIKGNKGAW